MWLPVYSHVSSRDSGGYLDHHIGGRPSLK